MKIAKIKLHKHQMEVFRDNHRFKVICAGRRFGKSNLARIIILNWAVKKKGMYWIVAPTFDQGKQIHWVQGYKVEMPRFMVDKWNEAELSITLNNGSIIQIRSADTPDRLVGVKLSGLVVDEIATMSKWDEIWQQCLRPTLTDFKAPALFISSPRGYNHFYDLYNKEKTSAQYKSFHFTSYDNPFVPSTEIDQAKRELDDNFFAQEYMAEFTRYTGLVYKDFTDEMIKPLDFKPVYWLRGLDRGYRNPTAITFIAVDENDHWHQVFEIYERELTNKALKERLDAVRDEIKKIDPFFADFEYSTMDSEATSDIADLEQNYDEYFTPVKKASGDSKLSYIQYKISQFGQRIRDKKFSISPECSNTINEFRTYAYSEKKSDSEVPLKVNDHAMDALGDLCSMYEFNYTKKIQEKPQGTYIESYEIYKRTNPDEIVIDDLEGVAI